MDYGNGQNGQGQVTGTPQGMQTYQPPQTQVQPVQQTTYQQTPQTYQPPPATPPQGWAPPGGQAPQTTQNAGGAPAAGGGSSNQELLDPGAPLQLNMQHQSAEWSDRGGTKIDPGFYNFDVEKAEAFLSSNKKPFLRLYLRIIDPGKFEGATFRYSWCTQHGINFFRGLMRAALGRDDGRVVPNEFIGKRFRAEIHYKPAFNDPDDTEMVIRSYEPFQGTAPNLQAQAPQGQAQQAPPNMYNMGGQGQG